MSLKLNFRDLIIRLCKEWSGVSVEAAIEEGLSTREKGNLAEAVSAKEIEKEGFIFAFSPQSLTPGDVFGLKEIIFENSYPFNGLDVVHIPIIQVKSSYKGKFPSISYDEQSNLEDFLIFAHEYILNYGTEIVQADILLISGWIDRVIIDLNTMTYRLNKEFVGFYENAFDKDILEALQIILNDTFPDRNVTGKITEEHFLLAELRNEI